MEMGSMRIPGKYQAVVPSKGLCWQREHQPSSKLMLELLQNQPWDKFTKTLKINTLEQGYWDLLTRELNKKEKQKTLKRNWMTLRTTQLWK